MDGVPGGDDVAEDEDDEDDEEDEEEEDDDVEGIKTERCISLISPRLQTNSPTKVVIASVIIFNTHQRPLLGNSANIRQAKKW